MRQHLINMEDLYNHVTGEDKGYEKPDVKAS